MPLFKLDALLFLYGIPSSLSSNTAVKMLSFQIVAHRLCINCAIISMIRSVIVKSESRRFKS